MKSTAHFFLLSTILVNGASASGIEVFTERAAFEARLASSQVVTFDPPSYSGPTDTLLGNMRFDEGNLTFTGVRLSVDSPTGGQYRSSLTSNVLTTDYGVAGPIGGITVISTEPIYALGAEFTYINGLDPSYRPFHTSVRVVLADGSLFELAAPAASTGLPLAFLGVLSDVPLGPVHLWDSTGGIAIDNASVTYVAPLPVPEPSSLLLLSVGLGIALCRCLIVRPERGAGQPGTSGICSSCA